MAIHDAKLQRKEKTTRHAGPAQKEKTFGRKRARPKGFIKDYGCTMSPPGATP